MALPGEGSKEGCAPAAALHAARALPCTVRPQSHAAVQGSESKVNVRH